MRSFSFLSCNDVNVLLADSIYQLISFFFVFFFSFQAFVHDPLINWRLFNFNEVPQMSTLASAHVPPVVNSEESSSDRELLQPQRGARERELLQVSINYACKVFWGCMLHAYSFISFSRRSIN